MRTSIRTVHDLRIVIAHLGEAETLAGMVGADLHRIGAHAAVFSDDDWSPSPNESTRSTPQLCLALAIDDGAVQEVSYFETEGFSSDGGRRLGQLVLSEFPRTPTGRSGR